MGTAGNLGTYQGRFRMKYIRIYILQLVPAQIVVAIAAGSCKAGCFHTVFLHGMENFHLIILYIFFYGIKAFL